MTSTPNNVKTLSDALEATRVEKGSNKNASEIDVNLMNRICEADRKNPDLLSGLLDLCDAFVVRNKNECDCDVLLDLLRDLLSFSSFNRYKFEWRVRRQVALSLATCGKNLVNFVFAANEEISLRVSKSRHDVRVSGNNKTQVVALSCAINLLVDDNYQVRHQACKFACDVTKRQLSSATSG